MTILEIESFDVAQTKTCSRGNVDKNIDIILHVRPDVAHLSHGINGLPGKWVYFVSDSIYLSSVSSALLSNNHARSPVDNGGIVWPMLLDSNP